MCETSRSSAGSEFDKQVPANTGLELSQQIIEQITGLDSVPTLTFNLPPSAENEPIPCSMTFLPEHVINVNEPGQDGNISPRLLVIGFVSYSDGATALSMVRFNATNTPLADSLLVDPLPPNH